MHRLLTLSKIFVGEVLIWRQQHGFRLFLPFFWRHQWLPIPSFLASGPDFSAFFTPLTRALHLGWLLLNRVR
jgi:hypothetical protein